MEGELCSYSCPIGADERGLTDEPSARVAQRQTAKVADGFTLHCCALDEAEPLGTARHMSPLRQIFGFRFYQRTVLTLLA
jgi:hypothetical protein